jgi:indolepyruvate ferredoxin oxidoreductase beta subunit
MSRKTSIILSGVGGQGVITAATILGKAAMKTGIMVYVSEVHGMAQRGGSVLCTVRMGDVSGALVLSGTADAILSMEPSETLRYLHYANKKTKIITDITPLIPFTVSVGMATYPDLNEVYNDIKRHAEFYKVDAGAIARNAGAQITKNTVMLGALAAADVLPFKPEILLQTILENIPKKFEEMNKKAFEGGLHALHHE